MPEQFQSYTFPASVAGWELPEMDHVIYDNHGFWVLVDIKLPYHRDIIPAKGAASTSSADLSIANGYHLQPPKCHPQSPTLGVCDVSRAKNAPTWAGLAWQVKC